MSDAEIPVARFVISKRAKDEIEHIRTLWNAEFPDNPADVASIDWAQWRPNVGEPWWGVCVSFYGRLQRAEIAHGIQIVSGLPVIFFTTAEHAPRFDGKVIDFAQGEGFFLRAP